MLLRLVTLHHKIVGRVPDYADYRRARRRLARGGETVSLETLERELEARR